MRLHGRAIDQDLRRRSAGRCECVEYIYPYALRCPADEAIVECFARTIDPWLAARIVRQKRLEPSELILR